MVISIIIADIYRIIYMYYWHGRLRIVAYLDANNSYNLNVIYS